MSLDPPVVSPLYPEEPDENCKAAIVQSLNVFSILQGWGAFDPSQGDQQQPGQSWWAWIWERWKIWCDTHPAPGPIIP